MTTFITIRTDVFMSNLFTTTVVVTNTVAPFFIREPPAKITFFVLFNFLI